MEPETTREIAVTARADPLSRAPIVTAKFGAPGCCATHPQWQFIDPSSQQSVAGCPAESPAIAMSDMSDMSDMSCP